MSTAAAPSATPTLLHSVPGRARLHLPCALDRSPERVERRFCAIDGVLSAHGNSTTGNVLVHYRPGAVRVAELLSVARELENGSASVEPSPDARKSSTPPSALTSRSGRHRRARITVRGLDRSPALGKRVEEALQAHPGVHAHANPLSGRVLVDITNEDVQLEDLLATVAQLEFPEIPGAGRPSHPLDPGPLRQSAIRVATSVAGLAVVALRQLGGFRTNSAFVSNAAYVTSILNSIPKLRGAMARVMGRDVAEATLTLPNIAAQTLGGNPIPLTLAGTEALTTFTETRAREKAWRQYEQQLAGAASATPGSMVRLENGDRLPLEGTIVEGSGTSTVRDGSSRQVEPGAQLESGARLFGGPFVIQLTDPGSFPPQRRNGEIGPGVYERYLQAAGPASLAYSAITALTTRSMERTFTSMLLVNPRVAMIGERAATTMASARVLRAGVTIVGTRPDRQIRRPHTVILDGARLLGHNPERVRQLVSTCKRHGVELLILDRIGSPHAYRMAERAGIKIGPGRDAVELVHQCQRGGRIVAFVSDGAHGGPAFDACDLAVGLTDRRHAFSARADLLATDLAGVAAIVEAGARRDEAITDAVVLSTAANLVGGALGVGGLALELSGKLAEVVALGAIGAGYVRLRGGERPAGALATLRDPHPERWGARGVDDVLHAVDSSEEGLTTSEAARRRTHGQTPLRRHPVGEAIVAQLRSPITIIMGVGALLSLFMGGGADVLVIAGTLTANVLLGAWQERKTSRVTEELEQRRTSIVHVLRDGTPRQLPSSSVVRGDVMLLAPGDRIAADARLLAADGLEVDEASLTGESLPVRKRVHGGAAHEQVLLDGSDVVAGSGRAVVFATGAQTRLGTTVAALDLDTPAGNPLADRLAQILHGALPPALVGGLVVTGIGLLRGETFLAQIALGISVAIAAVPEGLPLLAGVGEATVARRLAGRRAVVRRLASVEALGRVDVACVDKTGTLTEGRLSVQLVANLTDDAAPTGLSPALSDVLRAAAFASPHPDTLARARDGTDVAVLRAADDAAMSDASRAPRDREVPFQSMRPWHASLAHGRLYVKGAPEAVLARCNWVRQSGGIDGPLSPEAADAFEARARELAARGLRVLAVAEGNGSADPADPRELTALGFVALCDPLRAGVADAVGRCHDAGVRVLMLTGDHPETARVIARSAALLDGGDVLTGGEIAALDDAALGARLERATVVARATPLDKLRIVEALRSRGHTVAMTGDGVNDAPALRLADVGVAMGGSGTEVARQAADLVLTRDDFPTLVEALVEGRAFWRNLRQSVGMLLGGNLGELALIVGASALGMGAGLTPGQVLVINLVTDLLPGLALVMQPPEHRRLSDLAREGMTAFNGPLRDDVIRRAVATGLPSIAAFGLAGLTGTDPRSAGFAALVGTQLAQTLDAGRTDGAFTGPVQGAVAASGLALIGAFAVPAVRGALQLQVPTPAGVALILGASLAAPAVNGALSRIGSSRPKGDASFRVAAVASPSVAS